MHTITVILRNAKSVNFKQSSGQNSRKIIHRPEVAKARRVTEINYFMFLAFEHCSIKRELPKEP